ncbi:MAG: cytochrome c oxidase assembly protein [Acetobacteraceae bacterium]
MARSHAMQDIAVPAAIVVLGAIVGWASTSHPAAMPIWMPYDFSWFAWLGTWLFVWWYFRGVALLPRSERPSLWQQASFTLGMLLIYAVLQTRYLYLAEHEFFLSRFQHIAMHHLGPFLVALGVARAPLRKGTPAPLARVVFSDRAQKLIAPIQQPVAACILFAGLVVFWLVPVVHLRAMLSERLLWIMNWTMVLDGLLFWCIVLDRRPFPLARVGYGVRAAMAFAVIFPQIAAGALIVFSRHEIYPYYNICGRFLASVSPLYDQLVGGMIIWIPPVMMSGIAVVLVVNNLRLHEERSPPPTDPAAARISAMAASWTGRP